MKLLGDKIAVKLEEQPSTTEGGLVLPEGAKEKPVKGVVVEVGLGFQSDEEGKAEFVGVEKGDTVIFSKYGGITVEIAEDEEYLILRQSDILVVL